MLLDRSLTGTDELKDVGLATGEDVGLATGELVGHGRHGFHLFR